LAALTQRDHLGLSAALPNISQAESTADDHDHRNPDVGVRLRLTTNLCGGWWICWCDRLPVLGWPACAVDNRLRLHTTNLCWMMDLSGWPAPGVGVRLRLTTNLCWMMDLSGWLAAGVGVTGSRRWQPAAPHHPPMRTHRCAPACALDDGPVGVADSCRW